MDIGKIAGKIPKWIQQYRYPILVALAGLILLTIPGRSKKTTDTTLSTEPQTTQVDVSDQLAQLLSQMEGVGKVKVMLSIGVGQTTFYHSDEDIDTSEGSSSVRKETVIITDSQRNETPLVSYVVPPQYQGAVIVCQGGDDPTVKLAVVEAVSKAIGLGANQISVLKMK